MQTDFLIVGQGLAGSLLAWELLKRDRQVIVIDTGRENASTVAAGIINPVTGMRFVKSAGVENLLMAAKKCYGELSETFNECFYFDKAMVRIFQTKPERTYAEKRLLDPHYRAYLGKLSSGRDFGGFNTPEGYIEQQGGGYLNTNALLACLKQFLLERNSSRLTSFEYDIKFNNTAVFWRDIEAKQVIFCEGYQVQTNPWFSWLPLQPVKGEILAISYDKAMPEVIINFGNWLLPLGEGKVRLGATFDRSHIDTLPTVAGRESLLNNLRAYQPDMAQADVLAHQAGIRPCTLDKYPFVGKHPRYPQLAVFNGFGAKGSLQIPWYSRRFADHLLNQTPLPATCDIRRYEPTRFPG